MNIKKILISYSVISISLVVFLIALGYLDYMHSLALVLSLFFGLIVYALAYETYLESKPIYFWLTHALSYMLFRYLAFFFMFYIVFHAQNPLQATNAATMSLNANRVEHLNFSDDRDFEGKRHVFIFYKHGCKVCQRSQAKLYDFMKENPDLKDKMTYINIESEKGRELADKFDLSHAYFMVFREENGQFQVVDRSQDDFLDENKISAFFRIKEINKLTENLKQ